MKTKVKELVKNAPSQEEKIKVLYHYLQENMRYVSVQLGIGGWQTFDAKYVEENKYGDCKALTNFMKSMLKAADIEAYAALIKNGRNVLDQEIDFDFKIIGTDIDGRVMGMARANIEAAGLTKEIELHKKDFADFEAPQLKGVIVCNPPYGERIGENVDDLYTAFGDNLKNRYDGWNAWLISSNMGALKKVGLRPSRKIKLFNGSLECRFMKYEMYKGTKKVHKMKRSED